jgi:hypothetical protein
MALSREELRALVENRQNPSVSIYMPAHPKYSDVRQDPIRLKNLLRKAQEELTAIGMRPWEAKKLLRPARDLCTERPFWLQGGDGLALFRAPDRMRAYHVPRRFDELVVVGDRFHIKPLIGLLSDPQFYLLALSQNEIRLFHGTRHGIEELPLPADVPKRMEDAHGQDDLQPKLQLFMGARGERGSTAAVHHGYHTGNEDTRQDLLRYFHRVNRGLQSLLREERAPLVLAGVDYLLPLYREANTYAHLLERGVPGNPEGVRAEHLHQQAMELLAPYFLEAQQVAADRYRQLLGTGLASSNLMEIVPAAYLGRVEILFVAADVQQWGTFDPSRLTLRQHAEAEPGDDDLLDLAAVQTLLQGGVVYEGAPQDVPGDGPVAALYRY